MADAKGAYIGGAPVQFKDAAARAMISDEYNSAETYAKGNLCIYNGKIYEAIKETTGTWDATAWEETTLAKVNGKLNGDIASLTENFQWSDKKSLGDNGCGISLSYRYNEGLKLVELEWDGSINNEIAVGSAGYAWNGFPLDKSPKQNIFIPVAIGTSGVCIQFFPVAAQHSNKFTLITLTSNVSSGYCCGKYLYSYS